MAKLNTKGRAAAWALIVALISAWWYINPYPWLSFIVGLTAGLLTFGMLSTGCIERFRRLLFIGIPLVIVLTLADLYLQ